MAIPPAKYCQLSWMIHIKQEIVKIPIPMRMTNRPSWVMAVRSGYRIAESPTRSATGVFDEGREFPERRAGKVIILLRGQTTGYPAGPGSSGDFQEVTELDRGEVQSAGIEHQGSSGLGCAWCRICRGDACYCCDGLTHALKVPHLLNGSNFLWLIFVGIDLITIR